MKEIINIFPNDELKEMRIRNLKKSGAVHTIKNKDEVCSVVFITPYYFFLPVITWITAEKHRGKGLATKLVKKSQQKELILFAKTRNKASYRIAEKCGFKRIFRNYWVWVGLNWIWER